MKRENGSYLSVTRLTKSSYVDRKASTGTELASATYRHPAPAATGDVVRLEMLSMVWNPVNHTTL